MKREIKFKAWNKEANRFSKPFTLKSDVLNYTDDDGLGIVKSLTNEIILQYTGLKDKNGKEIYEGDVLKAHGIVTWNDTEYRWSAIDLNWNDKREWHDLDYLTSPFEIIGNIYENPELIET